MSVEYGEYEDSPTVDGKTLVSDLDDNTLLLVDETLEEDEASLSDLDSRPARIRLHPANESEDRIKYIDMTFDSLQMARLAYGLWKKCGPFNQPEGNAIPLKVATAGQDAIAAYLRVGNGYPKPRSNVAEMMGVTEQTVSNYCNRIRWTPSNE